MNEQQIMDLFGKSIYQIRLELTMGFYLQGMDAPAAWLRANEFLVFMEKYYNKEPK
jgi:hypothetical protein